MLRERTFLSLCLPATARPSATLLPWVADELWGEKNTSIVLGVSPLTSLMIDQCLAAEFVIIYMTSRNLAENIGSGVLGTILYQKLMSSII